MRDVEEAGKGVEVKFRKSVTGVGLWPLVHWRIRLRENAS